MSKGVVKDEFGKVSVSVKVADLPFSLFSRIISSLYTNSIDIEVDEVESALEALDYFSLAKTCIAQLLQRKFNPVC